MRGGSPVRAAASIDLAGKDVDFGKNGSVLFSSRAGAIRVHGANA
jgi:hypothetical protein